MKKILGYIVLIVVSVIVAIALFYSYYPTLVDAYQRHGILGVVVSVIVSIVLFILLFLLIRLTEWATKVINYKEEEPKDHGEIYKQILRPRRMDEKGEEKSLLWSDIKDFANKLDKEQLRQEAIVWGENGNGGGIYSIAIATDDLIDPTGECLEPISDYANSDDESDKEIAKSEPVVMKKGTLIIEVDF